MTKNKLQITQKRRYRIHNDLSNGAFHFKKELERRQRDRDEKGITFVAMSCLMMSAFAVESKINFVGEKIIKDWVERKPFREKLKIVCTALKIDLDKGGLRRTIYLLQECRDNIAHGKPLLLEKTFEVVVPEGTVYQPNDLKPEWLKLCSADQTISIYNEINEFLQLLLVKSGSKTFDASSNGEHQIDFLEKIED